MLMSRIYVVFDAEGNNMTIAYIVIMDLQVIKIKTVIAYNVYACLIILTLILFHSRDAHDCISQLEVREIPDLVLRCTFLAQSR